ncbi:MAG: Hydrogenase expression/formation protein [Candidatus Moranbacteria bacterium GW2011_GWF2_34_56]|nr:MAG: Hydrogenase expression/formation protein [Candidatus Moranbacteria bacterium GW2011_GWF1_34_10]KKP64570.1 MAG: Hydrogenase expression/formation protein [Candidatus Moranbacteria bacterium GW2011_GWF2_34_56]HBI16658.1 HypC/HybG/HupF family hydrogenase formation chaperone [Candidatus Moranbacteria bacterium]
MCLAFPGKIKNISGQNATVDFDGIEKEINISLLSDIKKGEYVIVHAGFAIEKVDKNAVNEIDELLK